MRQWKVIGRHNRWVEGAKITETLYIPVSNIRRFTSTIDGWGNFHIWQGSVTEIPPEGLVALVKSQVKQIRDRIRRGDESVFSEPGAW